MFFKSGMFSSVTNDWQMKKLRVESSFLRQMEVLGFASRLVGLNVRTFRLQGVLFAFVFR